ncbi:MAG: hypothetical protein AMXMBFR64_24090 [Myxococcales bacterium]
MSYQAVLARAIEILTKPTPVTWDRLYTAPEDKQQAIIELALALSVAMALIVIAGLTYGLLGYFLVFAVLQIGAVIGAVFAMARVVDLLVPYFGARAAGDNGVRLFAWASFPIAAVAALSALLMILRLTFGEYLMFAGVGYGAWLVYVAAPTFYGVPEEKRWPFVGAVYFIWLAILYTVTAIASRLAW